MVTGDSQEEVITDTDTQTDTHFIIIYIVNTLIYKNIKRGNLLAGSHPLRSLHRQSEQDVRVRHRTNPATNLPQLTNHSRTQDQDDEP